MMTFNLTIFSESGPPVHSAPLFKQLKLLKYKDIVEFRVAQFTYDCTHKHAPTQFHNWFTFIGDVHSHGTRQNVLVEGMPNNENKLSGNLFVPYVRTTHYGLRSIKVLAPKIWNRTPSIIRKAISRTSFAIAFKKDIILHY